MKKVIWKKDWGTWGVFCPYCDEWAYKKDHCVFCGKKYEWTDGGEKVPKPTIVEHMGYTIVQATNNHLQIYKNNRIIMHASCTKKMTEEELKKQVEFFENLKRSDKDGG